jgi:G3E family GTPase
LTGIAEPLPVAATFDFRDEAGDSLSDVARLDTMVTVVDAVNLLCDFSSHDVLSDRGESPGEGDERTLVNLLTDQIEFADLVILNKTTDAGPARVDAARKIIRALNPDARLIETDHSRVDPEAIFDTGLFDFDRAHEHPYWAKELYGFAHHTPETEEYGISSFVYRARRPFDPQRIHAVLNGDLPGVIRAKGHFWIATRPDWVAEFSLAGALSSVTPMGRWWAAVPRDRWPTHPGALAEVRAKWLDPFGDRRQELVFIGAGLDIAGIRARLDAALMPDTRFTSDDWTNLPDPFPRWGQRQAA